MHKLLQVREGENNLEYRVPAGTAFSLLLSAVHIRKAEVNLRVRLKGKGASATITGIIIESGEEMIHLHTTQSHEAPETTSDLLIKTVLSDRAKCLYDGGIRVEKAAQKTDAYQRNENLLLSGRAYAESKPSLEILANDVRCTHGSTTGPIDENELWYLSTRGIDKDTGERLITEGFVRSALMRVGGESIINGIWQTLFP